MMIKFIYEPNYPRIIFSVMMDARAGTPLANKPGTTQKQFIDNEIAKDTPDVIPYRLETDLGGMAGYISLLTANQGTKASLYQFMLRPTFKRLSIEI